KGSINQHGSYQTEGLMGVEVHVKDEARFPGKWAFFGFDDAKTAKMTPTAASCYSCHAQHGAVDTTFVQFYPTLLPIAKAKGTLPTGYQKEAPAPANSEGSAANKGARLPARATDGRADWDFDHADELDFQQINANSRTKDRAEGIDSSHRLHCSR